jgi:hypothetical protein
MKLIETARKYLGAPYKFGADINTTSQFDCSSLMYRIFFGAFDYTLPRTSKLQSALGQTIQYGEEHIGDLMFFDTLQRGDVSHVGVVVGRDEIRNAPIMIHANSVNNKVVEETLSGQYWQDTYLFTKRLNIPELKVIEFADISAESNEYETVRYFAEKDAIKYGSEVTFNPYFNFSRAEFCKVLFLSLGLSYQILPSNIFPDIQTHWVKNYAYDLYQKNIIKGFEDGTFRPDNLLKYEELAKMAIEAYQLSKTSTPSYENIPTDHWFYGYQGLIKEENLFDLEEIEFPLTKPISRIDALKFLKRLDNL